MVPERTSFNLVLRLPNGALTPLKRIVQAVTSANANLIRCPRTNGATVSPSLGLRYRSAPLLTSSRSLMLKSGVIVSNPNAYLEY